MEKGLDKKAMIISKFMTSYKMDNKQLQYTYCQISQKVKVIRHNVWSVIIM